MTDEQVVTTACSVRAVRQLRILLHLKGASITMVAHEIECMLKRAAPRLGLEDPKEGKKWKQKCGSEQLEC
jgi:hypothetical protein